MKAPSARTLQNFRLTLTKITGIACSVVLSSTLINSNARAGDVREVHGLSTIGVILAETVVSGDLRNEAVTTAKLADGAVTSDKLATVNINNGSGGAVTTATIANKAITHEKIADGAVRAAHLSALQSYTVGEIFTQYNVISKGSIKVTKDVNNRNVDVFSVEKDTGNVDTSGKLTVAGDASISSVVNGVGSQLSVNSTTIDSTVVGFDSTSALTSSSISQTATEAKVTVTNSHGNEHGLIVGTSSTTLSGGENTSVFTMDDDGVRFENGTGDAIKVTGVADGVTPFDAVNVSQLNAVGVGNGRQLNTIIDEVDTINREVDAINGELDTINRGVAMSMAMSSVPQAFNGQTSIGLGTARFNSQSAIAFGLSHHDENRNLTYSANAAHGGSGANAIAAGVGWSF